MLYHPTEWVAVSTKQKRTKILDIAKQILPESHYAIASRLFVVFMWFFSSLHAFPFYGAFCNSSSIFNTAIIIILHWVLILTLEDLSLAVTSNIEQINWVKQWRVVQHSLLFMLCHFYFERSGIQFYAFFIWKLHIFPFASHKQTHSCAISLLFSISV